jgi:hypothetical protein
VSFKTQNRKLIEKIKELIDDEQWCFSCRNIR